MVDDNIEELRHKLHWLLRDFRNLIEEKKYFIYSHQKNNETLIRHNVTLRQRENYIYSLNIEEYVAGPKQDDQHPGMYWEFGIFIDDDPIYIKLKIATDQQGNDFGFCYSFHDAEFPLKFPLRDN